MNRSNGLRQHLSVTSPRHQPPKRTALDCPRPKAREQLRMTRTLANTSAATRRRASLPVAELANFETPQNINSPASVLGNQGIESVPDCESHIGFESVPAPIRHMRAQPSLIPLWSLLVKQNGNTQSKRERSLICCHHTHDVRRPNSSYQTSFCKANIKEKSSITRQTSRQLA